MAQAVGFFVGDQEIMVLATQYRDKANQLDGMLARIATLSRQNQWCEVSQIIAELQQSGISIEGGEQYAATAQQRFEALQPHMATARSLLKRGHATKAAEHATLALQCVADYAEALGLERKSFETCLKDRTYDKKATQNFAEARSGGVEGTPAFVIGGKVVYKDQLLSTINQALLSVP